MAAAMTIDPTFEALAASRRAWVEEVLRPWCRCAPRRELLQAEQEWTDIAGRPAPEFSLWLWAWSRFPALYVEGLPGVDETYEVRVRLRGGAEHVGFPNARETRRGMLRLEGADGPLGPFSLDDIESIERC